MTRIQQFVTATVLAAGLGSGAVVAQTPEQAKGADQPLVSIIGCVDRVMPPPPPPGAPAAPSAPPAYKIIDVQPGSSAGQKPMTLASEYLVTGPASIAFSKYQNQWVEVTGRMLVAALSTPSTTPPAARGAKPLPATFSAQTIKVIATECK